jgi:phosphatidylinositol kinase/protein kinase (PI-3  family)
MREKYPEKVPFRLTRMLIKAMEVSGIEGSYRSTCERTMTVLRESRDSLVAMLEAFVHDPLISWRLVGLTATESQDRLSIGGGDEMRAVPSINPIGEVNDNGIGVVSGVPIDLNGRTSVLNAPITEGPDEDGDDELGDVLLPESVNDVPSISVRKAPRDAAAVSATRARSLQMYSNIQTWAANLSTDSRIASITGDDRAEQVAASGSIARSRVARSMRQREFFSLLDDEGGLGHAHEEALNEKALKVIRRVQDKLTGTDFPDRAENGEPLDVVDQVQRLIVQATSVENLCQLFIGWYVNLGFSLFVSLLLFAHTGAFLYYLGVHFGSELNPSNFSWLIYYVHIILRVIQYHAVLFLCHHSLYVNSCFSPIHIQPQGFQGFYPTRLRQRHRYHHKVSPWCAAFTQVLQSIH